MKKNTSCVVVAYNPGINVIENISSYIHYFDKVFVIDNSDSDNVQLFESLIRTFNLEYIPLLDNTGIAKALNIGFEKSIQAGYSFIISMDQDSQFDNNILDVYKNYIDKFGLTQLGALSPRYKVERTISKVSSKLYEEKTITMQSGVLFIKEVFQKIGLFNEALFIDVVDWEYFIRMNKLGFKLIQCNEAVLAHQPAENLHLFTFKGKKIGVGIAPPLRYYYQVRNLLWCLLHQKSFFMLTTIFYKIAKVLFLFKNKRTYLYFIFTGIKDAFKNKLGRFDKIHSK